MGKMFIFVHDGGMRAWDKEGGQTCEEWTGMGMRTEVGMRICLEERSR